MYADVVLPNLGFGMEEGKLVAWLKKPGDTVRKGEAIAEIEGDKATVELEAVTDGVLHEALYPADTVIPVGSVLARIRTGADAAAPAPARTADIGAGAELGGGTPVEINKLQPAADDAGDERISPVAARLARELSVDLSKVAGTGPGGRITRADVEAAVNQPAVGSNGASRGLAAPAVRRLARDNGIELGHIQGTGRDGRVTRADVEATIAGRGAAAAVSAPSISAPAPVAASYPSPQAERGEAATSAIEGRQEVELSRMRRAIAGRLQQSMNEAPHFYTTAELDLTDALKVLPARIGINNLLLYIATQTLMDMPELNATYENGHLYHYEHVNLSMAVALPNGLLSPVLHRADDYSLAALADRARDLIKRARDNKLRQDELGGGTFTLSNLGLIEQVERFTAIINPPQVGILAIGAAKDRPFVINGGIYVRKTVHLTLSADHRIIDGMVAGVFLQKFDEKLQAFSH